MTNCFRKYQANRQTAPDSHFVSEKMAKNITIKAPKQCRKVNNDYNAKFKWALKES